MPRANRHILPGRIDHLTHGRHHRQFLLRFAKDRDGYRARLGEAAVNVDASLLTYHITSNPVHVLTYADDPGQIAALMQQGAGELAQQQLQLEEQSGSWIVQECYDGLFGPEKKSMGTVATSNLCQLPPLEPVAVVRPE